MSQVVFWLLMLGAAAVIFITVSVAIRRYRSYSATQRVEEEDDEEEDPPTAANPNPAPPPRPTPPAAAPAAAGGGGSFNLGSLIGSIALIIVVLVIIFFIWKWWHGLKHDPHARGSHSVASSLHLPSLPTVVPVDNEGAVSCEPMEYRSLDLPPQACDVPVEGTKWVMQAPGTPEGLTICFVQDRNLFRKVEYLLRNDMVAHEYTFDYGPEKPLPAGVWAIRWIPNPAVFPEGARTTKVVYRLGKDGHCN